MREIKFRAWHKQNKTMVYFKNEILAVDIYQAISLCELLNGNHGDLLMQYTGLLDKNSKEIYEFDIVEFNRDIWRVEFDEGSWIIQDIKYDFPSFRELYISKDLKIIGNIYENQELLKEEVKL